MLARALPIINRVRNIKSMFAQWRSRLPVKYIVHIKVFMILSQIAIAKQKKNLTREKFIWWKIAYRVSKHIRKIKHESFNQLRKIAFTKRKERLYIIIRINHWFKLWNSKITVNMQNLEAGASKISYLQSLKDEDAANRFHRFHDFQKALKIWKSNFEKRNLQIKISVFFNQFRLQKNAIKFWRKRFLSGQKQIKFWNQNRSNFVCKTMFAYWKDQYHSVSMADECRKYILLKRTFEYWRDCKTEILMYRAHLSNDASDRVDKVKANFAGQIIYLQSKLEDRFRNYYLISRKFKEWKHKSLLSSGAVEFHKNFRISLYFRRFRASYYLESVSKLHHRFLIESTFNLWSRYFHMIRVSKEYRDRILKSVAFLHWIHRYKEVKDDKNQRRLKILVDSLVFWNNRVCKYIEMDQLAIEYHQRNFRDKSFQYWRRRLEDQIILEEEASLLHDREKISLVFNLWRNRMQYYSVEFTSFLTKKYFFIWRLKSNADYRKLRHLQQKWVLRRWINAIRTRRVVKKLKSLKECVSRFYEVKQRRYFKSKILINKEWHRNLMASELKLKLKGWIMYAKIQINRKYFNRWKKIKYLSLKIEMKLLQNYFKSWNEKLLTNFSQDLAARKNNRENHYCNHFFVWRQRYQEAVFTRQRKFKTLFKNFKLWRIVTNSVMKNPSQKTSSARNYAVLIRYFKIWYLITAALQFRQKKSYLKYFNVLRRGHQSDVVYNWKATRYFRKWLSLYEIQLFNEGRKMIFSEAWAEKQLQRKVLISWYELVIHNRSQLKMTKLLPQNTF